MTRILFVCYANICRSPMAEAVFNTLTPADAPLFAASAGIVVPTPGIVQSEGALAVLADHDIHHQGRAREVEPGALAAYDLILSMDWRILSMLLRHRTTRGETRLFLHDAHARGWVADPYPDGDYEAAFALIRTGCIALLETLQARVT